jgi:hypothetical protein
MDNPFRALLHGRNEKTIFPVFDLVFDTTCVGGGPLRAGGPLSEGLPSAQAEKGCAHRATIIGRLAGRVDRPPTNKSPDFC